MRLSTRAQRFTSLSVFSDRDGFTLQTRRGTKLCKEQIRRAPRPAQPHTPPRPSPLRRVDYAPRCRSDSVPTGALSEQGRPRPSSGGGGGHSASSINSPPVPSGRLSLARHEKPAGKPTPAGVSRFPKGDRACAPGPVATIQGIARGGQGQARGAASSKASAPD